MNNRTMNNNVNIKNDDEQVIFVAFDSYFIDHFICLSAIPRHSIEALKTKNEKIDEELNRIYSQSTKH